MEQSRLKSKVVWLAVLAQVLLVLGLFVGEDISSDIKLAGAAIIEILSVFGILNNPTNASGF